MFRGKRKPQQVIQCIKGDGSVQQLDRNKKEGENTMYTYKHEASYAADVVIC